MRDKMNAEEIEASRTLDLLRAGVHVNEAIVTRALYVLARASGAAPGFRSYPQVRLACAVCPGARQW